MDFKENDLKTKSKHDLAALLERYHPNETMHTLIKDELQRRQMKEQHRSNWRIAIFGVIGSLIVAAFGVWLSM